jgi:hypothetical protein
VGAAVPNNAYGASQPVWMAQTTEAMQPPVAGGQAWVGPAQTAPPMGEPAWTPPASPPPVSGPSAYGGAAYGSAAYGSAGCGCDQTMGGYSTLAGCADQCCCDTVRWGGRAGALLMGRDEANHYNFSFDSAIESNQLLDARDAYEDFLPGVEARIGRFNCCTGRGFEAVYWGLYPAESTAFAFDNHVTGDLNPILNFDQLDYNGGNASAFVNDAMVHRIRGNTEIHNAELNYLLGGPMHGSQWTMRGLIGFRYFNFSEDLEFASDVDDIVFDGSDDELYYNIDVDNNLYGGQLGAYAERTIGTSWAATFAVTAGVYANDASATSRIGGGAGLATINNGPNLGREWLVSADKTDIAFLGEVRAGLARQLTTNWRLAADYRVVAASGVALPTNQIFPDLRGLQDVEKLATNGTLILHGLFVGAERRY